jgi:hypothetical protein
MWHFRVIGRTHGKVCRERRPHQPLGFIHPTGVPQVTRVIVQGHRVSARSPEQTLVLPGAKTLRDVANSLACAWRNETVDETQHSLQ